jgi:mannose-6-phosphate isomerase-like protein (cupin superfamily)
MTVIDQASLPVDGNAREFHGHEHGDVGISFIMVDAPRGAGPRRHRHPYEEVFIVQEGRATFFLGDEEIEAGAGQIVVAPAGVAHAFVNSGDGRLRQIDIHVSPRMITEWLE